MKEKIRQQIDDRLRKLIPTLEYDVLYHQVDIIRKIRNRKSNFGMPNLMETLKTLVQELDLAMVTDIHHRCWSGTTRIMRIGEQAIDIPIPQEPDFIPGMPERKDWGLLTFNKRNEYEGLFRHYWINLAAMIERKGYGTRTGMSSPKFDTPWITDKVARAMHEEVFKEFIIESGLPTASGEDYKGSRRHLIIYYPRIIREVRDKK